MDGQAAGEHPGTIYCTDSQWSSLRITQATVNSTVHWCEVGDYKLALNKCNALSGSQPCRASSVIRAINCGSSLLNTGPS
jgi:hypothetical protein